MPYIPYIVNGTYFVSALCGLKGWEQPVVSSLVDTVSDT